MNDPNTWMDLWLKPEALDTHSLPDIAYPIPEHAFEHVLESGSLPFELMLYGLQLRANDDPDLWRSLSPAIDRLTELLAPEDPRTTLCVSGENWWLEVGPLDPGQELVALQREMEVIAAIRPLTDGRLRISTYRPLDAKSISYLIALGQTPHPDSGVCMRENNWAYALDGAAANGNAYAADRGEAYLSYWQYGLGISADGSSLPIWRDQLTLPHRRAAKVVTEIGVHYAYSDTCDGEG